MLIRRVPDTKDYQEDLNFYFQKMAAYWMEVYENKELQDLIYQERLQCVLECVDRIGLSPNPSALDIGCGAGHAAVNIAKRGYFVDAIDPVETMIESTRNLAKQAGLDGSVRTNLGDVHALSFPSDTFALVLAIGVLPWLPSIEQPMREMWRVLRPKGHLIVAVDNRWALRWVLEPQTSPLLRPLKTIVRRWIPRRRPKPTVQPSLTSIWAFDALLDATGFEKLDGISLGFGPFTFFGHHIFPDGIGLKTHRLIQRLAQRKTRVFRLLGSQYIVLARKTA
jgi:ubiquinone/menaquinone biosynthesis C-methylase UbiE